MIQLNLSKQKEEHLSEATYLLDQILDSLPPNRDWLDPRIEKAARNLVIERKAQQTSSTYTIVKGSDIYDEDYLIQRIPIIGTKVVIYSAWRLDPILKEDGRFHRCGTIHHDGDRWWGRIGTGPDCLEFADLPVGECRTKAVQGAYYGECQLAYQLILSVYPEVRNGEKDMGEISVTEVS